MSHDNLRKRITDLETTGGRPLNDLRFDFEDNGTWPTDGDELNRLANWLQVLAEIRLHHAAAPHDEPYEPLPRERDVAAVLELFGRAREGDAAARAEIHRAHMAREERYLW